MGNKVGVRIGIATMLTIFIVLCLAIFAALALSTARAEWRLAEQQAQAVRDYYAADLVCAELTDRLRTAHEDGADADRLAELAGREGAACTRTEKGWLAEFACEMSETQQLEIELALTADGVTVRRWETVSTAVWQADETIELWTGDW